MNFPIVKFQLENELDIVLAYKRAMKIAEACMFSISDQTSFATAVSEVCRNTMEHAKEGTISFYLQKGGHSYLHGEIVDKGKGFANIADVLSGKFAQGSNRGRGLMRTKKIVDLFKIESSNKGTKVNIAIKLHTKMIIDSAVVDSWMTGFKSEKPLSAYEELKKRNLLLFELSEQMKESEEQYRNLAEYAPLMVFTLDKDGRTNYINSWTEKFCGMNYEKIGREGWEEIIHPEDYQVYLSSWMDSKKDGLPLELEYRLKEEKSEEYRWHQFRLIPYKDEEGTVIKWIGFNIDIHAHKILEATLRDNTLLKLTQEKLQNKIQELNTSNAELEKFAFVASHDLQEPLRKIMLYSDRLILDVETNDAAKEMLERMHLSAKRMREMIQSLLALSMLDKKNIFKKQSLNLILKDVAGDFELDARSDVELYVEENLPSINGDPDQLKQLFQNLISNSIKYRKSITLKISITCTASNHNSIIISVKDNGIGFNEIYVDKIFEIFQRLHLKETYNGTGIGLAICKKVMSNHQGSITAKSNEGNGAEFLITFPALR